MQIVESTTLTPNQIYLLYSLKIKVVPLHINISLELRLLEAGEWLIDKKLTEKSLRIIDTLDKEKDIKVINTFSEKVKEYLETFPKIKLPTGKPARSNFNEVCDAFDWFFKTYSDYSWDVILKATENYVIQYQETSFMYMRTSKYFIRKQNADKTWSSDLAEQCQMVIDNIQNIEPKKFNSDVV